MTIRRPWWRTGVFRLGLLAVGVAAAAWAAWVQQHRPGAPVETPRARLIPEPVAVAPGVYLLGKTAPAAAYAIETSRGIVLVDSGLEADAARVIDQLLGLRLEVAKITAILLTHVHADHSLGAAHLRERTKAKIYAGRADCLPLRQGKPRDAFFSTFHMPAVPTHSTPVDVELQGDEVLDFGDTRIKAISTPGHTPGSICYLVERPKLRALFTGDVIQSLNPDTAGVLGTYAAHLPPHYRGNAGDYLGTLRRLRDLPLPDLVLPGHPQMDASPQDPAVTQTKWFALLDQGIAEIEKLIQRHAADGADFLDGTGKELLPGLHYFGDLGGSAIYCLQVKAGIILFDAPGGEALPDFLQQRFDERQWQNQPLLAVALTSADESATSGLTSLLKRRKCAVVAPTAALSSIKERCPEKTEVISASELPARHWLDARTLALEGRGQSPTANLMKVSGKEVLVSGRIPVKMSVPSFQQLLLDLKGREGIAGYARSLDQLVRIRPDLWLPSQPVHGQNANLYDGDWATVITQNKQMTQ